VLLQSLTRLETVNASFSLGMPEASEAGGLASLTSDATHWDDQYLKLVGPEIYRRPLGVVPASEATTFLRDWARQFLRPGKQLTTPVAVQDTDDGVLLRFLTRATGYADFDAESADDKWEAGRPDVVVANSGKPDGALLLVAETSPSPRVRVTRTEMADGVVVKEMSENDVLERLERDLSSLEAARRKEMGN